MSNIKSNLVGDPDIIKNITLDDLKKLANMLMDRNIVNIILEYDSKQIDFDTVAGKVMSKYNTLGIIKKSNYEYRYDDYDILKYGRHKLENNSEKANISIATKVRHSNPTGALAHTYINSLAANNRSLFSQYREIHGLTYNATISSSGIKYNNDLAIFETDCEADRLEESIELYKKSIIDLNEAFSKEEYLRVLGNRKLLSSTNLDLKKYIGYIDEKYYDIEFYKKLVSVSDVYKLIDAYYSETNFELVKEYLNTLAESVKRDELIILTDK